MSLGKPFSPRKHSSDFVKRQVGQGEKLDIVIVGDADSGKGIFLSALLGRKKVDPLMPLVKVVTVDGLRYQLNFTVCVGNERSYLLFDQPSKSANGFIFVFNVSLRHTFAAFERWRETIAPITDDDVPPVLMIGFAPDEMAKDRRCISAHESKMLADSYGFQHRDVDYDGDVSGLLQKMVADIRRDEFEAADEASATPLVDMIVLGDVFVGKTSMVNRLLTGEFESRYATSGAARPRKIKVIVDDVLAILRLRDTPGTMYQSIITPDFMNLIHSAVIVYDTTSRATFEAAQQIRQLVLSAKQTKRVSMVLVGNKIDDQFLTERQISYEEGLALAKSWKCPFFEVSCKTSNVDHIFKEAIREYRLTFNYDTVSSPKLEWSGFAQLNSSASGKFQKKWISIRSGRFTYSNKADSSKNKNFIDLNSDVGVIEGNHDKGALLILSVIGVTPHIQILLPSFADRAALADALFAELAFQRVVDELLQTVVKSSISSVAGSTELTSLTSPSSSSSSSSSLCILAHGRLPTLPVAGSQTILNGSSSSTVASGSGSTPFRRNR